MRAIGYTLSVPDNGTFIFREKSDLKRCAGCGYPISFLSHNPEYQLRKREADYQRGGYVKRGADLSGTYDLYYIVSERFRDFCLEEGYKGLIFREFAKDKLKIQLESAEFKRLTFLPAFGAGVADS